MIKRARGGNLICIIANYNHKEKWQRLYIFGKNKSPLSFSFFFIAASHCSSIKSHALGTTTISALSKVKTRLWHGTKGLRRCWLFVSKLASVQTGQYCFQGSCNSPACGKSWTFESSPAKTHVCETLDGRGMIYSQLILECSVAFSLSEEVPLPTVWYELFPSLSLCDASAIT